jgi:hypothetical protein
MRKNTLKSTLLTLVVSGILFTGSLPVCADPVDSYFQPWMYNITMTTDVLENMDYNLEREWMAGTMVDKNYELFESTYGILTINIIGSDLFVYGHLDGWYWNCIVTDDRYEMIKESMEETFGTPLKDESEVDGVTEVLEYSGPAFTEGTYDPVNWTMTGERSSTPIPVGNYYTQDELLSMNHSILLFRTGNMVSIQYCPTNLFGHMNSSYYRNALSSDN